MYNIKYGMFKELHSSMSSSKPSVYLNVATLISAHNMYKVLTWVLLLFANIDGITDFVLDKICEFFTFNFPGNVTGLRQSCELVYLSIHLLIYL